MRPLDLAIKASAGFPGIILGKMKLMVMATHRVTMKIKIFLRIYFNHDHLFQKRRGIPLLYIFQFI